MNQLALNLDAPITRGTARKRDRQTAVDAALSMSTGHLTNQQMLVLRRLSWRLDGTAYEIASELGMQQSVVARRFTDLGQMGMAERNGIKREGSTGRFCDCWQVTRDGLRWLEGVVDVPTGERL
jgi:DNA-binding MarR family transcriptional regulator